MGNKPLVILNYFIFKLPTPTTEELRKSFTLQYKIVVTGDDEVGKSK